MPGDLDSILNFQKKMDVYERLSNALEFTKCSFKKITIIIMKNSMKSTFWENIKIVVLHDFI